MRKSAARAVETTPPAVDTGIRSDVTVNSIAVAIFDVLECLLGVLLLHFGHNTHCGCAGWLLCWGTVNCGPTVVIWLDMLYCEMLKVLC